MNRGIALVGMSNVGKSYWRRKFEAANFKTICCDDLIEKRLRHILEKSGFEGIHDVARWMGMPFDPQYPENSALYLKCENEVMDEVVHRLFMGEKLVVDTTGSVIYTKDEIQSALMTVSKIVLLDISNGLEGELLRKFVAEPKPVIWGSGVYSPLPDEDPMVALYRCYPELLMKRREAYLGIAHKILEHDLFRSPGFNVSDFVRIIS